MPQILAGVGVLAVIGALLWLGMQAERGGPGDGEVRIAVDAKL
jgi:hypothetical protein